MEHDCAERTNVETKGWFFFLAIKAEFLQLQWWPQGHVDISIDTLK